jgi:hypothetical protein
MELDKKERTRVDEKSTIIGGTPGRAGLKVTLLPA